MKNEIDGPYNPTHNWNGASARNTNYLYENCFIFFYAGMQFAIERVSEKEIQVVTGFWTKWIPNQHGRIGVGGRFDGRSGWRVAVIMDDIRKRAWMLVDPLSRKVSKYDDDDIWEINIPRSK